MASARLPCLQDSKHFSIIIELPNTNPPRYLHTGIAIASIATAFILYALEVNSVGVEGCLAFTAVLHSSLPHVPSCICTTYLEFASLPAP